jgi:integrase
MSAKSRKVKLTEAICKSTTCPPGAERITLADTRMPGLVLRVAESGAKAFYTYRWFQGQPIKVKLGDWPAITLEQARDLANQANMKIAGGIDPRTERHAARAEMTLGELFSLYLEVHAKPHKRSWQADVSRFHATLEQWSKRKLSSIRQQDVAALHARLGRKRMVTMPPKIGADGTEIAPAREVEVGGQYTANRTRALLSKMFTIARQSGYRGENPVAHVQKFPEQERERFLAADELPRFFGALDDLVGEAHERVTKARTDGRKGEQRAAERVARERESFRDYVYLLLLTGARRRSVGAMSWLDVNLERGTWRIPSTKSGDPVTVVLTPDAIEILTRRQQNGDGRWVFPSTGASGHYEDPRTAWETLLARAGLADLRLHDLRRTLGSWMAANNTSLTVIGKSLGHRAGSGATSIYARLELDPVRQAVGRATDAMLSLRKQA